LPEAAAQKWLNAELTGKTNRGDVAEILLQAWWCLTENKAFTESAPSEKERREGWRAAVNYLRKISAHQIKLRGLLTQRAD
jgi:hypothetical protein